MAAVHIPETKPPKQLLQSCYCHIIADMSRINIGHRRSEDGSWSVVLNGKAYTLDDQPQ